MWPVYAIQTWRKKRQEQRREREENRRAWAEILSVAAEQQIYDLVCHIHWNRLTPGSRPYMAIRAVADARRRGTPYELSLQLERRRELIESTDRNGYHVYWTGAPSKHPGSWLDSTSAPDYAAELEKYYAYLEQQVNAGRITRLSSGEKIRAGLRDELMLKHQAWERISMSAWEAEIMATDGRCCKCWGSGTASVPLMDYEYEEMGCVLCCRTGKIDADTLRIYREPSVDVSDTDVAIVSEGMEFKFHTELAVLQRQDAHL